MPARLLEAAKEALTLDQAADFVPGRPHVATVWRWARKGVRGVRLGTILIGGRRMTTPALIEAFLCELNAGEGLSPGNSLRVMEAAP